MSPGRFERKTWSISVEPMPSTIAQPKWRSKRWPISLGRASPADEHIRNATASRLGSAGDAGGGAEEDGGSQVLSRAGGGARAAGPALEHRVGRRPLGHQDDARADRERKGQRVA